MSADSIRILHFADLHLGVETYGSIDAETGYSSRMIDILNALDYLVTYAIEKRVHLVLFCGDAYKDRSPNPTQQRELAKRIKRLSENGIAVFILTGNHDLPNAVNRATATEIFDTLAVKNVYVASKPDLYLIDIQGRKIQIVALPWLRRANLMSHEEIKNLDIASIFNKMEQLLTLAIKKYSRNLDQSLPSILASHIWVKGAQIGSEKGSTIGKEPEIMLSNIALPELDYVALGHIHRRQVLSTNPPVVYPGSLVKLDFSDSDDQKGFYEVEIDQDENGQRHTSFSFHPVPGRNFVSINVDLKPEDLDPTCTVLRQIEANSQAIQESIVRLNIDMPESLEGFLRDPDIRQYLKTAHYYSVSKKISRVARSRLDTSMAAESIPPIEALKLWLDTIEINSEQKTNILKVCQELIYELSN